MQGLVVIGAGGHGREVLDVAIAAGVPVLGVLDDDPSPDNLERLARRNIAHLGPIDALADVDATWVLGIGDSAARRSVDERACALAAERVAEPLVHPSATVGSDCRLGPGVVLTAGARLTTNVDLARHVHLNIGAVVSHDCVVGAYSTLSPGVLVNGGAVLGEGVFAGTGAIVMLLRNVGDRATIGAGAVVTRDVPPGVKARGVPARW